MSPGPAAVSLGAFGVLAQVVMVRSLLALMGGSEVALAVSLLFWMLFTASGSLAAARFVRVFGAEAPGVVFSTLALLVPMSVVGVYFLARLVATVPGHALSPLQMVVVAGVGLAPLCLCQGVAFTRMAAHLGGGGMYVREAGGAVAAGIISALVTPRLADGVLVVLAVSSLLPAAFTTSRIRLAAVAAVVLAAVVGYFTPAWGVGVLFHPRQVSPGPPVAAGLLLVSRDRGQVSLSLNGSMVATDAADPEAEANLAVLLSSGPKPRGLLVSGGDPGSLRRSLQALSGLVPDTVLYQYEDPGLLAAMQRLFPEQVPGAFSIVPVRTSLLPLLERPHEILPAGVLAGMSPQRPLEGFALWLRAGEPISLLENRHYTRETFSAASHALSGPGGRMSFCLGDGGVYMPTDDARRIARVVRGAQQAPDARGLSVAVRGQFQWLVWLDPTRPPAPGFQTLSVQDIWPALKEQPLVYLNQRELAQSLDPERAQGVLALLDSDLAPNTMDHPLTVAESLWSRTRVTVPSLGPFPDAVTGLSPQVRSILILFVVLPLAVLRRRLGSRTGRLLGMACVAAAAMTAEVMLLFAYQARSGMMYTRMGLLLSGFMAGGSLGAWWAVRHPRLTPGKAAATTLPLLALAATIAVCAPDLLGEIVLAVALLSGMGAGLGMTFAVSSQPADITGGSGKTAAAVNAADYLGASLAAALAATAMLPVLGMGASLLLTLGLAAAAAVGSRV